MFIPCGIKVCTPGAHLHFSELTSDLMKKIFPLPIYTAFLLLFILNLPKGSTQPKVPAPPATRTVFEYLTKEDEIVKLTIETDLTTIIENKKTNQYFPGALITEEGQSYKIELKPRGRYRRKVSDIPPLKIKFSKKGLRAQGLDSLNEIKLVLPWHDNAESDELVIKEYLIYRMFERLTPMSIRARLVRLTLRDTHVEKSKKTMYAILVEDEEETAVRLKGKLVEEYGIPMDSMVTNQAALVAVFQYMIGNTDWEIPMIRNIRLLRAPESGKIVVLPYDFDFSGFVSAPYASPASESGLKTVRDRFLMANGIKADSLKWATQTLKASKKDLLDICLSKYLPRSTSDQMIAYLETYFHQISEKDEVPQFLKMPMTD